jgi:beta-lactamase class A
MMGRSDNTAADHLIHELGRSRLSEMLARLRLDAATRNQPFLTTGEMFRLKLAASPEVRDRFVRGDLASRERLLRDEVARLELSQAQPLQRPLLIEHVEWHFSAADLARLLDEVRQHAQAERLLPLLALQAPLAVDAAHWSYLGFKGGSECGVFNVTLLLQRRQGGWFALVLTWNNPAADVNPALLFELLERAVLLLERS